MFFLRLFVRARSLMLLVASPLALWAGSLQPERLRTEYLENPLGLDALQPRLGWIVTSPARAQRQTAYQILVASSPERLRNGKGDLWDSGKVASDSTGPIRYAGQPLSAGQPAWWCVRVWDDADAPSSWSAPASWEMGPLSPADWHGHWIGRAAYTGPLGANDQPTPLLRRAFRLEADVRQARVHFIGLGHGELSVNGQRIGNTLLEPAFTRYDRRVLYVTHDITSALRRGENVLGVLLANNWFNVTAKAAWNFDQAPWRATPRLLLEARIELVDGRTVTIASDGQWKTSDSPITFSGIYGGENYDARREQPGWDRPGFDDAHWQPALAVDAPKGSISAQAMHPIRVTQEIRPVAVTQPAPGVTVFDAGQNLTGNAAIRLAGPAGTTVSLVYGEKLDARGRVDQSSIAVHVRRFGADQQFQTDRYTLRGLPAGVESWHSRFAYHGFRYVEVTGAPQPLSADALTVRVYHTDLPRTGEFACSNPLLERLWTAGRWSYFSNLFGLPTDCPHREKNGWTADAHVACEQGLFYGDGFTVYEKWIRDIGDEQRLTGALPGIVPTNGEWGYGFGSGPAWDSAFLIIPWYLYEYYGDDALLRRHYDGFKKYVDYLGTRAHDHIVRIGLGDWSPWKTKTPEDLTDTAYYFRDAQMVAAVARLLGHTAEAKKYEARAAAIRAAFQQKFYDPATARYSIGSQTAQGCALYQGLVPVAEIPRVVQELVAVVERNQNHLDFGLLGSKYVLRALTAYGRADVAYAIAAQKTQPSWGWWLEQGATTLLEGWTMGASNNHTFLGDVNAWMMHALAGINPDPARPGFRHIIIRPHPVGDLTSARAAYDSVRGRIESAWRIVGERLQLEVTVPANCTATVYLPARAGTDLFESDQPLASANGVRLERWENGRAVLTVGSGHYRFAAPR